MEVFIDLQEQHPTEYYNTLWAPLLFRCVPLRFLVTATNARTTATSHSCDSFGILVFEGEACWFYHVTPGFQWSAVNSRSDRRHTFSRSGLSTNWRSYIQNSLKDPWCWRWEGVTLWRLDENIQTVLKMRGSDTLKVGWEHTNSAEDEREWHFEGWVRTYKQCWNRLQRASAIYKPNNEREVEHSAKTKCEFCIRQRHNWYKSLWNLVIHESQSILCRYIAQLYFYTLQRKRRRKTFENWHVCRAMANIHTSKCVCVCVCVCIWCP